MSEECDRYDLVKFYAMVIFLRQMALFQNWLLVYPQGVKIYSLPTNKQPNRKLVTLSADEMMIVITLFVKS